MARWPTAGPPARRNPPAMSPVIPVRTAGASFSVDRTCGLAVIVIADMDDQIGLAAGRTAGNRGKRPSLRVVAILDRASFKPTTGVADDDDPPHFLWQDRSRRVPDDELASHGRRSRIAHHDREVVVRTGTRRHREVDPIRRRLWTNCAGSDRNANGKSAVGRQFRPWPWPVRSPRVGR